MLASRRHTDAAVGVHRESDRDRGSIVEDNTGNHVLWGVGHSVLFRHPLGHEREDAQHEVVLRGKDHGGQDYWGIDEYRKADQ
jgi:hypothetical protein